jgi:prepilin-type N-terminal cleavage/methylation domain-containing protein
MKHQQGFTLIEIMVSLAIVGILAATAVPLYRTFQQRAYGSEATILMKSLLEGQIIYYLENDKFYPAVGNTVSVFKNDAPDSEGVQQIKAALKIQVPVGHYMDFRILNDGDRCYVYIDADFALFKNGQTYLYAVLDKDGNVIYTTP